MTTATRKRRPTAAQRRNADIEFWEQRRKACNAEIERVQKLHAQLDRYMKVAARALRRAIAASDAIADNTSRDVSALLNAVVPWLGGVGIAEAAADLLRVEVSLCDDDARKQMDAGEIADMHKSLRRAEQFEAARKLVEDSP